ncbi:unnamed protein product [Dimorphilus gyrociliatus]|uniref:Uncharacterized protein n=1 Tax=Dimorphilus gyrociliatus TaxID=2664684 RepID=A0A7I8VLW3_9ANNE|nr:unnamed protein product [Dimorphilus gyrociliatus]
MSKISLERQSRGGRGKRVRIRVRETEREGDKETERESTRAVLTTTRNGIYGEMTAVPINIVLKDKRIHVIRQIK